MRRLARAVRAHQRDRLAVPDAEGNAPQRLGPVGIGVSQLFTSTIW
jgi:chromosome condensin MukBEF complex kleisin-like MukF subunit